MFEDGKIEITNYDNLRIYSNCNCNNTSSLIDELLLEKGACVQFKFVEGNWYIVSSDGLKMG